MSYYVAADNNFMTASYSTIPAAFSLCAWIKKAVTSPETQAAIISITDNGATGYTRLYINDGGVAADHAGPGLRVDKLTTQGESAPNNNNGDLSSWIGIIGTYPGGGTSDEPRTYLGSSSAYNTSNSAGSGTFPTASGSWKLFLSDINVRRLDGYLAHVCIFDYVLSGTAIANFMAGRNPMDATSFTGGAPVWYNMMTNGLGTGDSGVRNAQVGSLTNSGATLFASDNPSVDAPPTSGTVVVPLIAQYRRQMGA